MRSDTDLLLDILDSIDAIEKYTSKGREVFESNEFVQVWAVHHLQIIGEACRAMSKEIHDTESAIPWKGVIGMRNILVH
ncbi:MAG TPA: HepT-like ribonuclease domain-containing protein [Methanospirillum sp.]|nr:HepT-like ribonuclease domain-containing protein [Methanospirillum sp.]